MFLLFEEVWYVEKLRVKGKVRGLMYSCYQLEGRPSNIDTALP